MSRLRSLAPWLVPATLAVGLSALGATRGDESLNDLPYFADAASRLGLDTYADPGLQVGPLWLAAIRAADAVHAHAALAFLVVAGGAALVAVTLLRLVADRPRGPLLAAAGTTLALVLGLPYLAYTSGHAAQLLVPLLWLHASLDANRGRGGRAGVLVGAAAGLETWGLLGLPLLLALPRAAALRAAAAAVAVAGATYLPFVLAGEFRMAEYRWAVADGTLVSLVLDGGFPWGLRLVQGALAAGAAAALVLATRRSVPGGIAAAGALVVVRLLLDPVLYSWYWIPPQLLAIALGVSLAAAPRGLAGRLPGNRSAGWTGGPERIAIAASPAPWRRRSSSRPWQRPPSSSQS